MVAKSVCRTCKYVRMANGEHTFSYCAYLLITGSRRPAAKPGEDCGGYAERKKRILGSKPRVHEWDRLKWREAEEGETDDSEGYGVPVLREEDHLHNDGEGPDPG